MHLSKLKAIKISPRIAASVVVVCTALLVVVEWRSLYILDHPKPYKVSCIECHSDKKTLEAMADKAGDRLYLVHSGELNEAQLNHLLTKPSATGAKKSSKSY